MLKIVVLELGINFGGRPQPQLHSPDLFVLGLLVGFEILLIIVAIVDKLGTAMYRRGFAKPFYVKGHRVHHVCIYYIASTAYIILSVLLYLGYAQLVWNGLWVRIGSIFLILGITLAIDFLGDKYWPRIRKNVILHHEWIYSIVPMYVLLYVINVIV